MGNCKSISDRGELRSAPAWVAALRAPWRSLRSRQLDEFLGLQRPALRRGQSSSNLDELVRKLTQEPIPLLNADDNSDLQLAIAKLNNANILHTEKRAIERLLAQRYEEALAAAAAAEDNAAIVLGGASEVLRQILVVFTQNNLPTELDHTAAAGPPAEWRVRNHAARRRAFLVVRALVRLKREVKRLGMPIAELEWMAPVAAQERWGELKGLAAQYRALEGKLQDAELAITHLTQLRELEPKEGPAKQPPGRSPQPRALRSSGGRASNTGGRAVSESGGGPARRPRSTLQDGLQPPTAGVPGVRGSRQNGTLPVGGGGAPTSAPALGRGAAAAAPGASPLRAALLGRKGGAGGSDGAAPVPAPAPAPSALVPTLSPLRVPPAPSSALVAPLQRRMSLGGGPGLSPVGSGGGALPSLQRPSINGGSGSILSSAVPQLPSPPLRTLTKEASMGPRLFAHSSTLLVRQTFMNGTPSEPASSSGHTLPPVVVHRATHAQLDASVSSPVPGSAGHAALAEAADRFHTASGAGAPDADAYSPMRPSVSGMEPSPPVGPPPGPNPRRPLGPMSQSSPVPVAPGGGTGSGTPRPQSALSAPTGATPEPMYNVPTPFSAPASGARGAGSVPALALAAAAPLSTSTPGTISGAAPAPEAALPVLIQEGETIEQALARFQVAADDTRGALVDTARQFRTLLDLCNSSWSDQRWWLAAKTQEEVALDSWPTSDEYTVNRADMVRCLKAGSVAFQFMCFSEEPLVGPTGNRFDWWTSDPWEVAVDFAPDLASAPPPVSAANGADGAPAPHRSERLVGMPFGVRVLQQLVNSVTEAAGPLALETLPVILHVSERQQEAIVADLLQYSVYRRLRRNLFLVVQRSQPAMRYSAERHSYVAAPDQPAYIPGTGYAMLQLLWPGHAMFVNDTGELERLHTSLMQELKRRNTEWFVSRSALDLAMLQDDGALDMRTLAHVSSLWTHMRFSVSIEAASTYVKHRDLIAQHNSVLLCRKPKVAGMVVGRLDAAVRVDRYGGGARAELPVVELHTCELNSAHMQTELQNIANARSTTTSVGLGRYVFRFEVLAKLLTGPTIFRPKLLPAVDVKAYGTSAYKATDDDAGAPAPAANGAAAPAGAAAAAGGGANAMAAFVTAGGLTESQLAAAASQGLDTVQLRLHLSLTDVTMHHAVKVVALRAHRPPVLVRGPQDGAALVAVLQRSDEDLRNATQRLAAKLPSFARHQRPGQNILVFVQDNSVSLTAVNVAAGLVRRERKDKVFLLTVVPTELQRSEGTALLDRLLKAFRTHVAVSTHVMVQEGRGLLECVGDMLSAHHIGLLIVGSASITSMVTATPRGPLAAPPGTATGRPPGAATPKAPGTPSRAPGTAMASAGGGAGRGGTSVSGGAPTGPGALGGAADDANVENLVSSVALSILRTFPLPCILVTANTRTYLKRHGNEPAVHHPNAPVRPAMGAPPGGRLVAMAVVERHGRPAMHHFARCMLEPSLRQDMLMLAQVLPPGLAPGNQGYDPTCIQAVALKTLMANYESIAGDNEFHSPLKVYVQGEWQNAICAAARDNGAQLLCLQLPPSTTASGWASSLSPPMLQLIRAAPCPVLIYPTRSSSALETSDGLGFD